MTPSAAAVATAASTALPPSRSTRSPAAVASGSTLATAPPQPYAVGVFLVTRTGRARLGVGGGRRCTDEQAGGEGEAEQAGAHPSN